MKKVKDVLKNQVCNLSERNILSFVMSFYESSRIQFSLFNLPLGLTIAVLKRNIFLDRLILELVMELHYDAVFFSF